MAHFFKQIFTWWNGNTIGTRFFTWRKGKRIGEDQFGNIYYEGGLHKDGYPHRWVIYKDYSEPSTIPPGWHGWIHHRCEYPPTQEDYHPYEWEKPHVANMTGTSEAYRPKGAIPYNDEPPCVREDYDAWSPKK
ncbi:NADH:ubiquinone oxidoreductase subunit NDUFA12 [Bartonella kosoyi]|uniref:NADH:ubiquinone oxidoreductase subunit NDUFA12 n=1 Tax=Bartonella kosoyi TaxID=2133959 RepID=A0A5B9CX76_9HYPH|nr:NADH:ubiquinone oxidoreductase subunit NDUFA12 [Bartonella kosoyi]QEE09164.1 NADH:ubiquinone oxidoreductase subunit NDUFA12 [Bartonella kosoyi]